MMVLDSSALLAFLLRERGHDVVSLALPAGLISAVNYSEVLARIAREQISARTLHPKISQYGLTVVEFDTAQAVVAGEIRDRARQHGIGLADCCCMALAIHRALPVLTGDHAWANLGLDLSIEMFR